MKRRGTAGCAAPGRQGHRRASCALTASATAQPGQGTGRGARPRRRRGPRAPILFPGNFKFRTGAGQGGTAARPAVTSPPSFLQRPGPSLVRRPRAAGGDHILHGPGERAPACARPESWRRRGGGLRGGPGRGRQAGGGAPRSLHAGLTVARASLPFFPELGCQVWFGGVTSQGDMRTGPSDVDTGQPDAGLRTFQQWPVRLVLLPGSDGFPQTARVTRELAPRPRARRLSAGRPCPCPAGMGGATEAAGVPGPGPQHLRRLQGSR